MIGPLSRYTIYLQDWCSDFLKSIIFHVIVTTWEKRQALSTSLWDKVQTCSKHILPATTWIQQIGFSSALKDKYRQFKKLWGFRSQRESSWRYNELHMCDLRLKVSSFHTQSRERDKNLSARKECECIYCRCSNSSLPYTLKTVLKEVELHATKTMGKFVKVNFLPSSCIENRCLRKLKKNTLGPLKFIFLCLISHIMMMF